MRAEFAANNIQTNGSGPSGAQPAFFVTGNAAQMNDTTTGVNFGSGQKLKIASGATVTDVNAGQAAWS